MTEFRPDRIVQLDPLPGANILWFDPNIDEGYLLMRTDDSEDLNTLKSIRDNQKTLLPDGMTLEIYSDNLPNATAASRLIELAIEDSLDGETRREDLESIIGAQATLLLMPLLWPSESDQASDYREVMLPHRREIYELSLAYRLRKRETRKVLDRILLLSTDEGE